MLWVVVTQMTVKMSSVGLIAGDDSPQSDSQLLLRVFQNLPQGYLGTDPQICWCRFLLTVSFHGYGCCQPTVKPLT